jgi:DNA polymerase-1
MPTLLLVDGSSYLYRAFHAMPDLRTTQNEPTGAIHGVLNMLRRLENDYQAAGIDYKGCVFDAKGKTFRDDWYPQYKANRPPMPDDMIRQIEPLHAAIAALGWPLLMFDGVEADDVIGTLAVQAAAQGVQVVVSTGDKDLAQLVGPRVRLVNTMSSELLDEAGVIGKFGVPAGRIVDYLALIGDTVDNVPGVDKVGSKTAIKWLEQYGSLDGIIAAAPDIGGVVGQNLRRALDFLPLARRLVTVRCDLDLALAPTDLKPRPIDRERLVEIFSHYEMRSWLKEVQGDRASRMPTDDGALPATAPSTQADLLADAAHRAAYQTILDWPAFERWLEKIGHSPLTALDTETTSLDPFAARLVGVSLAVGPGAKRPTYRSPTTTPEHQRNCLATKCWRVSSPGSNRHDTPRSASTSSTTSMYWPTTAFISPVWHTTHCCNRTSSNPARTAFAATIWVSSRLVTSASRRSPTKCSAARERSRSVSTRWRSIKASEYAAEDADLCLRLHERLYPQIAADAGLLRVYQDIEIPVRDILFRMERTGVLIDTELLKQQSQEIGKRLLEIEARAYAAAGQPFNLNSPKQLAEILFDKLGLPVKKEDCLGNAVDRRGGALRTRTRLSITEDPARIATTRETQGHLYRQAAENGQCRQPAACTPATRRRSRSLAGWHRATPTCRTSRCAPPKAGASARPSSRRRAVASSRPTIRRSNCASWRISRKTRACSKPSRRAKTCIAPPPPRFSASAGRSRSRPAARRQGHQLRADLRHERFRPRARARPRTRRRAGLHRALFRALPRVAATWRRRADGQGRRAMSKPFSAAGCGCRKSAPARPAVARAPSGQRSTRRCRVRRPI